MGNRGVPDPSPEQIRQRCWQIQDTWTPHEECKRRGGSTDIAPPVQRWHGDVLDGE